MCIPYLPARLVKGETRFYIVYYQTNPVSGERERFRETFNLNRIRCKRQRIIEAKRIIDAINEKLPHGYPYDEFVGSSQLVLEALQDAVNIKIRLSDRKESHFAYSGMITIVTDFFEHYNLEGVTMDQFDAAMAKRFLKWSIVIRGVSNVTRNNYCIRMKSLLNEVLNDPADNPFKGIAQLKPKPKVRRAITSREAQLILNLSEKESPQLKLSILMLYHCFIRPAEQRRLRVGDIDLDRQIIRISAATAKNKQDSSVIIPDAMMEYFRSMDLGRNGSLFLFGRKHAPGPVAIGKRKMAIYHDKVLQKLRDQHQIHDTNGLTLYSWKDTGVIHLINQGVNIRDIQRQLRHHSLEMTEKYVDSLVFVSDQIKNAGNELQY